MQPFFMMITDDNCHRKSEGVHKNIECTPSLDYIKAQLESLRSS